MTNRERFEAELAKVHRDGVDKLLHYIRTSDFYTAPSSTRFHLSCNGGLLQHSLNVLDALRDILVHNEDGSYSYMILGQEKANISEESLVLITLMHDICKTHFYTVEKRNKKIDGQWREVDTYAIDDEFPYGHGEKSVFMLESMIRLSMEERMCIRWHMGAFSGDNNVQLSYGSAVDKWPMILALHTADMYASHFMEDTEGNKPEYRANAEQGDI